VLDSTVFEKLEPQIIDEVTLSKKGLIRQINISKSQVNRDAWTIQNRIHHLGEEESKVLRRIEETKALAEKIKKHRVERDSKAQAYRELQQELTREVLRKKFAVLQMKQNHETAAAARKLTNTLQVAEISQEIKKQRKLHLQQIELKSIAEVVRN
jgi:hypothetical protein